MAKHKEQSSFDTRAVVCSAALGILLGITMWCMVEIIAFREIPSLGSSPHRTLLAVIATTFVVVVGFVASCLIIKKMPRVIEKASRRNPWKWMPLTFDVKSIAIGALAMLVLWSPNIVVQFPAAMNFDTYEQLYQFMTPAPTYYYIPDMHYDAEFVDHHPVFDTLAYGSFFWVGNALGSQNAGLFACALFQCILTASILSAGCCYLSTLDVPKVFRILSLLFCALFPYIPLWAMTLMKDSLHAPIFVGFLICVFETFRSRGKALQSTRWLVCLVLFGCLTVLTKKTGAAIVVPSMIVLAIYCNVDRMKTILATAAVPAICFGLIPAIVYPAIGGVQPGGTQEGLGFAMQQVMTVVAEDDDLSDEERASVARVLDYEAAVKNYEAGFIDPVKNVAYPSATTDDYIAFLQSYASIGVRHIDLYTRSCLEIAAGFYCPGAITKYYALVEPNARFLKVYGPDLEKAGLQFNTYRPEALQPANHAIEDTIDKYKNNPIARFLFGRGLYGGWIPLICLMLCLYRDKRYIISFLPILISMALLLICPVVSSRYVLMLILATPFELGVACAALSDERSIILANDA